MKLETVRLLCAAAAGGSLFYLYITFLSAFLSNPEAYPKTTLELVIFGSQTFKLGVVLSVRRLRLARTALVWVIFSLETLLIPLLSAAYALTGDVGYLTVFRQVFAVWAVSLLLVVSPYLILRFCADLYGTSSLKKVLTSAVMEFSFFAFIARIFLSGAGSAPSMEALLGLFLNSIRGAMLSGRELLLLPASLLTPPSIVFYLSLVIYAALPPKGASEVNAPTALLIPLLGTTALLGWVLFAVEFIPNALISLAIPSVVIVGLVWLVGKRGH